MIGKLRKFMYDLASFISPHHVIRCKLPKSTLLQYKGIGVIISQYAKIGEGCKIYHNVTIGQEPVGTNQCPVIEDNVTIYPGCVIVGAITIGHDSIIGANTFINHNIPPNSTVYTQQNLVIKTK